MKTAVDTSTVQTILLTQSSAFSQEPIQEADTPWELFVGGGLLVGGLVLAIAATNYTQRHRRRIVPQSIRHTQKVGTSNRHSRPHSNSYRGSSSGSSHSDSSCSSYDSSSSGSSHSDSSCSSYDSSPSSWSSDNSSSCTSYDSSSSGSSDSTSSGSSDSGSSGGGGAGGDW